MNFKKYFLIFLFILLINFGSAGFFDSFNSCGDGTKIGECSKNSPYFCDENGILIEKASICGCPNLTEIQGNLCISPYQENPKEINLTYFFSGKEFNISMIVYEKMANYLFYSPDYLFYSNGEEPKKDDFKLRKINEENQRILLMPLVIKIQNLEKNTENQARIAISLVQNIEFGYSNESLSVGGYSINYSRYPYEVLYNEQGTCASKSELLVFLLREIGYETVFFYHEKENHDSVGIKCPEEYGFLNTSYCFVEATGPSILADNENIYLGGEKLTSYPKIIKASEGISLKYMREYRDSEILKEMRRRIEQRGGLNFFQHFSFRILQRRYGL